MLSQIFAITGVNLKSIPERWGPSLVIIIGLAGRGGGVHRAAGDERGLQRHPRRHRQQGQCPGHARRFGHRAELGPRPRRNQSDQARARHSQGCRRQAAGLGRNHRDRRAVQDRRDPQRLEPHRPRRGTGRVRAAAQDEDRRRPAVQAGPARTGGRPKREQAVRRRAGRQDPAHARLGLDGGRRLRIRRRAPRASCGPTWRSRSPASAATATARCWPGWKARNRSRAWARR